MIVRLNVPTVEDMHALGRDLARLARAGDLIILVGGLGAGKTALAQGIGEGLGVAGAVISPTFVLARIHRSVSGGLGLVHVDAYRLNNRQEIDDLDLEAEMPQAVTVVEWGRGLAEQLSPARLDIEISRSLAADDETRTVQITATGQRWANLVEDWQQLVNQQMGRDPVADATGGDGV